jgi:hypothetical protein
VLAVFSPVGGVWQGDGVSADSDGEPGGRPAAPGSLRLLQRFLNTVDLEPGVEGLGDAAALAAWLREVDLPAGRPPEAAAVTQGDVTQARLLREALRDLLDARTHPGADAGGWQPAAGRQLAARQHPAAGQRPDAGRRPAVSQRPAVGQRLGDLMARYPLVPAVHGTRLTLHAAGGGVRGALSELLAVAVLADADGSLTRLKVCAADRCRWVFYDASRSRSGTWCTMSICGSRAKARDYRDRRVGPTAP